jgi:hypothetical protein
MPSLLRPLLHPLAFHLGIWGPCHPLSLALALWLAPSHEPSTNVSAWRPGTLLPLSGLLLWPVAGLTLVATRALTRKRAPLGDLARAWHLAQLPFLPYLLVTGLAFDGIEGNIAGFIVVPASALWLLVAAPASLAIYVLVAIRAVRRASTTAAASSSQPSEA